MALKPPTPPGVCGQTVSDFYQMARTLKPDTMKFVSIAGTPALLAAFIFAAGCSKDGGKNTTASGLPLQRPVTNEYHGVKVAEDYQWLENATAPDVQKWSAAQNVQARSYLDKLETRPLVHEQLDRLFAQTSPNYSSLTWRAGKLFLLKFQPPAQQPVLVTLKSPSDLTNETVVLDPNKLSADGSVAIDRKSVV